MLDTIIMYYEIQFLHRVFVITCMMMHNISYVSSLYTACNVVIAIDLLCICNHDMWSHVDDLLCMHACFCFSKLSEHL